MPPEPRLLRRLPRHLPRRVPLRAVPALAERVWRLPLAVAVLLFVAAGPAQSLGRTDLVSLFCLTGLALAVAAVPLGLVALLTEENP